MPSRPIHQILSDRPFVSVPAETPVREVVRQMDALQLDALTFGAELVRREEITVIL